VAAARPLATATSASTACPPNCSDSGFREARGFSKNGLSTQCHLQTQGATANACDWPQRHGVRCACTLAWRMQAKCHVVCKTSICGMFCAPAVVPVCLRTCCWTCLVHAARAQDAAPVVQCTMCSNKRARRGNAAYHLCQMLADHNSGVPVPLTTLPPTCFCFDIRQVSQPLDSESGFALASRCVNQPSAL
jgi:hypothetical protein